jgi:two-component system OmpR family sensor kinase
MAELINHVRADRPLIDAVRTQLAGIHRTRAAVMRPRATRQMVLNLVAVLALIAAVVASLARAGGPAVGGAPAVVLLMAGLAASAGSAAALMVMFAGRLMDNPRVIWVGLALGWYSLLAIPISTVSGLDGAHQPVASAALVLVHAAAAVLWLLVVVAPAPPRATESVLVFLGVASLLLLGAARWAVTSPALAETVAGSRPLWLVYALAWVVSALAVVGTATVGRVPGLGVIGTGLAMLGAVQVGRLLISSSSGGEVPPLFAALRLAAVVVVLWGSFRLVRWAFLLLDDDQAAKEDELHRAEVRLIRAAERDHDLRNGLAGLAGATAVLGSGTGTGQLSRAVAGELRRLDVMLAAPADDDPRLPRGAYAVAPALDGLVMLRRSAGMDLRADVEPHLYAVGCPSTLAQVVTNLLANAERHAPGSPVRIVAARRQGRVEIRVRDFGPGVAVGEEHAVLEPGVRDDRAGGQGLGLHLCRTLLAAEDAGIEILPATAGSPGCVVVLDLPACEILGSGSPGPERHDVHAVS